MNQRKDLLSVSELNDYLKMMMDGDRVLSNVWVRGEISNFKAHSSGHLYFSMKDAKGQLRCVMFVSNAMRLRFRLEDGMKVIAHGHVSVYGASGQYQLYAEELQPDGVGSLALQFEQLKQKLAQEGLFAPERKRPLPPLPRRIGVITSPTGAAVHDIKNVLGRRFPLAEMILFPSAVQGAEAPEQLRLGLEFFGQTDLVDVIIIGRGGGSAEDLWAFNDEALARAVAACPIPVISAVGHESDFTICDFVADRRAPTPSAAAELAVPNSEDVLAYFTGCKERLQASLLRRISQERQSLSHLAKNRVLTRPELLLDGYRMRLAENEKELSNTVSRVQERKSVSLQTVAGRLEALSPLSVLSRGYAVVYRDDHMLSRAADVQSGDRLQIRFADGTVNAEAINEKGE